MPIINFLKYNNAVPVGIAIVMLGGGAAFAASDPSAVYSQSTSVMSVDNTYLIGKDLNAYSPTVQILSVTEDELTYYVTYRISTIDIEDYVWKDVTRDQQLQVTKAELGQYRDLGVYVTEIMKNIVDRELLRLKDTQNSEKGHVSQKVVATQYGGIVGKFLDSKTETLPGYTPVVKEPDFSHEEGVSPIPPSQGGVGGSASGGSVQTVPASGTNPPVLKILGNNPAEVPMGSTYNDLGAVITSVPSNYTIHVFFGDSEVQQVSLDTTKTGEYTITYKAWNEKGETGEAIRTVRVIDPNANVQPDPTPTPAPAEVPVSVPDVSQPNPDPEASAPVQ